jgi:hypothetical protein
VPVDSADADPVAVVQGYSPDLNWRQLAEGAVAIRRGMPWVATNLDPTVPSPRGPLPGNGSMVAALRVATGVEPVSTGKPDPTMHRETVERSAARRPLVVGDRLDTDIEGANAVGCASLLVLTGVTTAAELLSAPARLRPWFLAEDVSGVLEPAPEVILRDGAVTCGRWRAAVGSCAAGDSEVRDSEVRDSAVRLRATASRSDPGDTVDALRTLAVAAWSVLDARDASSGRPVSGPTESSSLPALRADDEAAAEMLRRLGVKPSSRG